MAKRTKTNSVNNHGPANLLILNFPSRKLMREFKKSLLEMEGDIIVGYGNCVEFGGCMPNVPFKPQLMYDNTIEFKKDVYENN